MVRLRCLVPVTLLLLTFAPFHQAVASAPATTRPATAPAARGVLIISIDGLRPDVLLRADMPTLRRLMDRGSFTMWARTTPQSITLPSHVSMLTGVEPDIHGIQWNGDLPLDRPVYPAVPTLFDLARKAGFRTALVAGKSKFVSSTAPETLDASWISADSVCDDARVTAEAVRIVSEIAPDVLFVHLPTMDSVGHADGWGSPKQLAAAAEADACVARLLAAYAGRLDSTLVIVTADHGGAGRTHGPDDPRSRTIPWIAAGPGVRAGFDLSLLGKGHDVNTYDTFSTACHFLGLRPPRRTQGRAVIEIFQRGELLGDR